MPLAETVKIARHKTVKDWFERAAELEANPTEKLWQRTYVEFFEARLDSRYFDPIEKISSGPQLDGEGFAIVAIYCTLIEFLEATYQGKEFISRAPESETVYGFSGPMFKKFLRNRPPFNEIFINEDLAKDFYDGVRNGLLHEARTKDNWRIRTDRKAKVSIDSANKIIYRNLLKRDFKDYLKWYEAELISKVEVQKAFKQKFSSLCG